MDQDIGIEALLDFSFLTEENAIVEKFCRDLQLQMSEEGRINQLRKSISDPNWLKLLSGEWFRDVRSKRHQRNLFGADIVRASIRRRKKPKAHEQEFKQQSSLENIDVIHEPVPEDENTMEALDVPEDENTMEALGVPEDEKTTEAMDVLLPETIMPQSPQLTETLEVDLTSKDAVCSQELIVENILERSSSFSSLSSETGEVEQEEQPGSDPALKDVVQNNKGLENGQRSTLTSLPSKENPVSPQSKGVNASSSASSLSSSTYKIEKAELQGRVLNLSVWHHDTLGRNLFMGEVEIALNAWDWSDTSPKWFNLQPKTPATPDTVPDHGKLNLALKFIPAGSEERGLPPTGELHMWVKNAENLVPRWGPRYILPDDTKLSRQKTRTVKKTLNPTFNHTMVYDGFEVKDLAEACAEFTVWHRETFSKQRLGGIRLSLGTGNSYGLPVPWMDSSEEERHTWEMVFKHPREWVEATLPLRTNLNPRTSS